MSSSGLAVAGAGALLAVSILAVVLNRSPRVMPVVYGASLAIALCLLALALLNLVGGAETVSRVVLPVGLPWLGAHFRLDALSAFVLAIIGLGGAAAGLYALDYGRHEEAPQRVLPFFPAFLAGMTLVVLADDAFTFLLSWEFMSLTSWALVVAHHEDRANLRAGLIYLVMASFGTLALLLAFGLLAGPDGGYGFETIRLAEHDSFVRGLVLALVLLGAGSKAGLIPLHVWLPLAHPAAPSHVSALMSGVMTKVAVYGFIRVIFDLIGEPEWWVSLPLILLGGVTALLGILHALMESDLKRALAYSTIENIGVVFVSLGLTVAFQANGLPWAAALALAAALFHMFNHALFKSLLFFAAGAVLTVTGARDMEKLGGLIHRMPKTAIVCLVACVAIAALPPLNGFASEWLTFQAILQSPQLPQWGLKIMVPAVGGLLALAAALAAACFVKLYGITFLGRPRTEAAAEATEVGRFSLAAMVLFAALCVAAGILPGLFIDALSPVTLALLGDRLPAQSAAPWLSIIPIAEGRSSYNGLLVFVFIASSAILAAFIIHRFASRAVRRAVAWDCGSPAPGPVTQYTAGSFAQPLRRIFGTLMFQARERVEMPPPGDGRPARFEVVLKDLIWEYLYAPLAAAVGLAAERLNHLQFLTIRRYLSLVFLALVVLLLVLALWP